MRHTFFGLLFLTLLIQTSAFGQRNFTNNFNNANELMTDVTGKPIYLQVNYNIDGTPFFPEDYRRGSIKTAGGKLYENLLLKFNMLEDKLLMKLDDGTELVTITPVSQVIIDGITGVVNAKVFQHGYPVTDGHTLTTWYEVLDSGKMQLLKLREVKYDDKRYYGQASITRVFTISEIYYLFSNDKMIKLQKGRDALVLQMADKRDEMYAYLNVNDLSCKKESDWIKAVNHYNSLFPSN
jgi:hypothetical protein